jgi:uncharacterized protein (TIGR00730 family)
MPNSARIGSICVFCGSSDAADPALLKAAAAFGALLAREGIRLVYGGGGIGLMGACARAAHTAGGQVLGVMPDFLRKPEIVYGDVEVIVVSSMHERKLTMFRESDAFVIFPGGVGTLDEAIELISWRRLELHRKPTVFYNADGYWEPLFALFRHMVDQRMAPPALLDTWLAVDHLEAILPALTQLADRAPQMLSPLMPARE